MNITRVQASGSLDQATNYQASEGWTTNKAGYHFHNWYGFDAVDVDAAVAMARSYTANSLPSLLNRTFNSDLAKAVTIPDNKASGVTRTINVSEDLSIENFTVQLLIDHPDTSEVGIEITSPAGTKSILLNIRSSIIDGSRRTKRTVFGLQKVAGSSSFHPDRQ